MSRASCCFWIPLVVAVGTLGLLAAFGANGWPGDVGAVGAEFCEMSYAGPIAQPSNTLSNAGFYLVGLWIGWRAWRDVRAPKKATWSNKLVTTVAYPASYATSSVLIGFGSSALHASTTPWSAECDLLSMHLWGAWCIAFTTTRLFRRGDRDFWGLLLAQIALLGVRIALGHPDGMKGSDLFASMIVVAIAIELVGRWRNCRSVKMDNHYLGLAIVLFLTAYGFFLVGRTDNPACDAASPWQAHAAWHLISSGSTLCTYLYGRSERSLPA